VTLVDIDHLGAAGVANLLLRATDIVRKDPKRRGSCVHLGNVGRLLVTGDLHDNPIHFVKVVAFAQLQDPHNHLILHELIHGEHLTYDTDMSWRMLAKVAKLIEQYPGQVHVMLANHELAQAFDQLVSKGAGENTALFRAGLDFIFGDEADIVDQAIRVFIRALPLAVKTENGLMCSHSLPSVLDMKSFDTGILDRALQESDYALRSGSAWQMTWGRKQNPEQLAALAATWGVKVFIAGHAAVPEGAVAAGPQLVLINSDHDRGVVLPVQLASEISNAQDLVLLIVPISSIRELPGV
jgi:hypothetical protein